MPSLKPDNQCLEHFARSRDEAAFREIVERHYGLVLGAARRRLRGNDELAEQLRRRGVTVSIAVLTAGLTVELTKGASTAAASKGMTNSIAGDSDDRRESAQNAAIMSWAPVDIEAAAEWLDRIGPYDDSILSLAEPYAPVDFEKSVAWAQRASDGRRDEVVAKALAKALRHHAPEVLVPYLGAGNLSPEAMAKKIGMTQPGTVSAFD